MNSIRNLLSPAKLAVVLVFLLTAALPALAQSSVFTYQGKLQEAGLPANGTYDFQFKLYNAQGAQLPVAGGACPGPTTLEHTGVQVTHGTFSVQLNFGPTATCQDQVFSGDLRWLEIATRHNGGPYVTLSPRQQITSIPYAIRADSARRLGNAGDPIGALRFRGINLDFPSTPDNSISDYEWTVTGAEVSNAVFLSVPNASVIALTSYSAWVSAANTVTIRFTNQSGSTKDPAGAAFWVLLIQ